MKKKKFWLLIVIIIFLSILILEQFQFIEAVDIYGKNIQSLFSHSSFEIIFLIITNMMSILGITMIIGITIFFLRKKDVSRDIVIYIGTILICLLLTNLIKIFVRRTRPIDMLLEVSGFSFPSGHSSMAMVVYGYLIILIKKYYQGKQKKFYMFLCSLFILLTGLSRIYFNVHYVTDVIAGFILGFILLCFSSFIIKKMDKMQKNDKIVTIKKGRGILW